MQYLEKTKRHHDERNDYLQHHITPLEEKIIEVDKLKKRKQDLIMKILFIHNLQRRQVQLIQAMQGIVRKFPPGIYFNTMKKFDEDFVILGVAQSHNEISKLIKQYKSSTWLHDPVLNVVRVISGEEGKFSEFDISISYKQLNEKE